MTIQPKYLHLLENETVKRWYDNLKAKSVLTATTWLRTLGYYCELQNTNPDSLKKALEEVNFRNTFSDFVREIKLTPDDEKILRGTHE